MAKRDAAGLALAKKWGTKSGKLIGSPPLGKSDNIKAQPLPRQGLSIGALAKKLKISVGIIHGMISAGGVPKPPARPPEEPIIIKNPPKPLEEPELDDPLDEEDIPPPPPRMPPSVPEKWVRRPKSPIWEA